MIYVYFFLRSLCSLLPTHFNRSWSRRFIQKCLKIARGYFFLPLFANPRIVLNFIPDLYPVVLNYFLSFILYHGCHQCYITQVNRVLKTLPVLPVYHVYIVLPLTFYLVAMRIFTAIRDSLGNARVVYICAARCACARCSSRAKTVQKYPFFALFDATRLRILMTA